MRSLERCDNLAPGGVVLWIGGKRHHRVEAKSHRVPLDLNVALLKDIEESYLNFTGEVRELVHGKDTAVGTGQ